MVLPAHFPQTGRKNPVGYKYFGWAGIPTNFRPGLDALYRQYFRMVLQVCLRYTRNREDAEDLVSEVFIKLQNYDRLHPSETHPKSWIYSIAVNHCLDYLRSRNARHECLFEEGDGRSMRETDHGDACDARITLERVFRGLDPVLRQCLYSKFVEGMTYEETASLVGISREAVAKRIERFIEKARRIQEEAGSPEACLSGPAVSAAPTAELAGFWPPGRERGSNTRREERFSPPHP